MSIIKHFSIEDRRGETIAAEIKPLLCKKVFSVCSKVQTTLDTLSRPAPHLCLSSASSAEQDSILRETAKVVGKSQKIKQKSPKSYDFGLKWRRVWDSNPRGLASKRFSRPPRYDRFDNPPSEKNRPKSADTEKYSVDKNCEEAARCPSRTVHYYSTKSKENQGLAEGQR